MIYLVEDDENIRKLVSYALTKEGYTVKAFEEPYLFWKAMECELPGMILLDIMLPGEDGLSILAKLQSRDATKYIPVIILSAKGSEFDRVTGLDMGADDYIAKPFGMTELVSRVKAIWRRYEKTKEEKKTYTVKNLFVDPKKHIIKVSGKAVELSFKEYALLMVLLEAEGDVVKRDTLLSRVWGEFYEESRTLDVHIRKLRVKLGESGDVIKTVKGIGYRIGGEGDA